MKFGYQDIKGVLPVVQMPYHDDYSIDETTLKGEVDWLLGMGVHGLTMAMVSETVRLTDAERDWVAWLLVEYADGKVPVIVSVGDESTFQALHHARAASKAGASALMAIPPTLVKADGKSLYEYYQALVEATSLPVIVQDASGYLGNSIPLTTLVRLYETYPQHIMFKPEAQPMGPNLSLLRNAVGEKATIFEGTGGVQLLSNYRRGIQGTIPGADLAWAVLAIWQALEVKDEQRASTLQFPLTAILSQLSTLDSYLAVEKMLLVKQGIFKNTRIRGPGKYTLDQPFSKEITHYFNQLVQFAENK
jgi:2-keto-3-deoxy-L-arabinonate dehydratase